MDSERMVGDRRCWPCTLANSAVGLMIAWVPLAAMLLAGNRSAVPAATAWGVLITAYTAYRLVRQGRLPVAESVAKRTGLHDRIGPESDLCKEARGNRQGSDRRQDDSAKSK